MERNQHFLSASPLLLCRVTGRETRGTEEGGASGLVSGRDVSRRGIRAGGGTQQTTALLGRIRLKASLRYQLQLMNNADLPYPSTRPSRSSGRGDVGGGAAGVACSHAGRDLKGRLASSLCGVEITRSLTLTLVLHAALLLAPSSTGHLFDTVECHVGTSPCGGFSARDHHYMIKRDPGQEDHRRAGRRTTPQRQGVLKCREPFSGRGWARPDAGADPNDLVSRARLKREAELRASAVPPHHRHLPADPALNRYPPDPARCPSRLLARLPLPVTIVPAFTSARLQSISLISFSWIRC
ncbi:hypothetical protein E2C01_030376 [Portunus trituberculatus]|uniref:Uncharacterized protein n=1 Tax=Portunus trituberculatus TaxID=210409 RepID=A0A5B7EUL2_PORTR|nr:hypothetical protein [Portunus trituberculatus]